MQSSHRPHLRALLALLASLPAIASAATAYTWDGGGDANTSGGWTTAANWNPDGIPGFGGDQATLGDVTTGTRTITISGGTSTGVSLISFNQSTAGAVNLLSIQNNFSLSNGFALDATAGTEAISVGTASTGVTLTVNNPGTIGVNGVLELQRTSALVGTGSLTLSGGALNVAAVTGSGSSQATVGLDFAMTSGSIVIDNAGTGIVRDRRLAFSGNVNITGGTIGSTHTGISGGVFLNGATNVLDPASFDGKLNLYIAANGDQSLTTNQSFAGAGITLRGHGTKTITSTGGGTINAIGFLDANASGSIGTTLKLGSDLALAGGAAQPAVSTFGNTADSGSAIQFGIDTAGHTFDLRAGASSGVWTPLNTTQSGITNTTWTLSNSGAAGAGKIQANAFNFTATGAVVNVGSGLVLEAHGGNGTATNLGTAGTFDSTASFVYAGGADAAAPATLASGRTIGALRVGDGALQITGSAFIAAGGVAVDAGGLLDFTTQTVAAGGPGLALGIDGVSAGQIRALGDYAFGGALTIDFASVATTGTHDLFDFTTARADGSDFTSVTLTGLHSANLILSAGVWSGSADGFTFAFNEATGDLLVTGAIPEPTTFAMIAGLGTLALAVHRRRRRA